MMKRFGSLLTSFGLAGLHTPATQAMEMSTPSYTHVVVQSGDWNDAATWEGGSFPGNDAIVHVPVGMELNVPKTPKASPKLTSIHVDGKLLLSGTASKTKLTVQTLNVNSGGLLRVGNKSSPVPIDHVVEFVFWADEAWQPTMDDPLASRGGLMVNDGTVKMYGAKRQHYRSLAEDALSGDTEIKVTKNDGTWNVDDTIVIASTDFTPDGALQNEVRTITRINRKTITLDRPLEYDHQTFDCAPYDGGAFMCETAVHVAHLSRSIILRSSASAADEIGTRGHVMVMGQCENAYFKGVLFEDLGRTDKSVPIDDSKIGGTGMVATAGSNPRARYPLHFHECGAGTDSDPTVLNDPATVKNSVVHGSPGWGMVNHSSHVHFEENVVYDFTGAGFVAESGDERGAFINNISMGGTGNGTFPFRRTYSQDEVRFPLADMGFHGDGFWFQGTLTEIRDNIAAGNKGVGFMFYPLGIEVVTPSTNPTKSGVGIDEALIPIESATDTARIWDSGESEGLRLVVDLPLYEFTNNTAYGNYVGVKFRYVQNGNAVGFKKFGIKRHLPDADAQEYHEYNVDMLTLWNNHIGIHSTYNSKAVIRDALIATNLLVDIDETHDDRAQLERANVGVEAWHPSNSGIVLDTSMVIGYEYGILQSGGTDELVVEDVHFEDNVADQRDINKAEEGADYREIRRDALPLD